MTTVTLEEAQAKLPELVASLESGEVAITQGERVVARLVAAPPARAPRVPGSAKGILVIVADDDEHLEDFKEYM